MLAACGLGFSYRAGTPVLRDVSIELAPGSFTGDSRGERMRQVDASVMPDGTPKARCGAGVPRCVPVGEVQAAWRGRKRSRSSPQHSHANRLTVYDSVLVGRHPLMQGAPTEADHVVVRETLERLGLSAYSLRYADELSGGEYQKMVLARAFVQQAETLLLDEPTNNLDPANQQEVMREVRREVDERGIAACAVMHDINLAIRYCDLLLFLKGGEVDAVGGRECVTPERIKRIYGMDADIIEHGGRLVVIPR